MDINDAAKKAIIESFRKKCPPYNPPKKPYLDLTEPIDTHRNCKFTNTKKSTRKKC